MKMLEATSGKPVTYYAGGTWSKAGPADFEAFKKLVDEAAKTIK